jgi:hypothetical protein
MPPASRVANQALPCDIVAAPHDACCYAAWPFLGVSSLNLAAHPRAAFSFRAVWGRNFAGLRRSAVDFGAHARLMIIGEQRALP